MTKNIYLRYLISSYGLVERSNKKSEKVTVNKKKLITAHFLWRLIMAEVSKRAELVPEPPC